MQTVSYGHWKLLATATPWCHEGCQLVGRSGLVLWLPSHTVHVSLPYETAHKTITLEPTYEPANIKNLSSELGKSYYIMQCLKGITCVNILERM